MTRSDGHTGADVDWLAVGVDIGGTKIAAGAVDDTGTVLARARAQTPHLSTSPSVVESAIVEVVDEVLTRVGRDRVGAVGIGAAGFVAADRATVTFAPHLSWRNEPLRDALQGRLGLPVTVDNDANASAWAEWKFGAGRGESHLLVVNLGTGIGGAIVIDGQLQRGRYGLAGEFGHVQVVPDGRLCECGNTGCWEQYASGNVLVRRAQALLASTSAMATDLRARVAAAGGLTGALVTAAAREGDRAALEMLAEVGAWLGVGIAGLAAAFDPGTVVVGGGVSQAGDLLLDPARAAYARHLTGRGFRPLANVVAAALGPDAGLVGAADLARLEHAGGVTR
ncbi:MAG: ROK family glucokinase [Dermatophilaceae bacterium]